MLPYRLLFNIGSKAVGGFMQKRAEKKAARKGKGRHWPGATTRAQEKQIKIGVGASPSLADRHQLNGDLARVFPFPIGSLQSNGLTGLSGANEAQQIIGALNGFAFNGHDDIPLL